MKRHFFVSLGLMAVFFGGVLWGPGLVLAHCDGLDGPVVTAAKKALETEDIHFVLMWVQKKDEAEIEKTFQKTLAVRKLNPEAKDLADRYFFETLVRVHRAGEGEPYTGIKPAGRDLGPAIPAGDKAVADGKLEPLYRLLTKNIHDTLHHKFEEVMKRKNFKKDDVLAGREYVEAYVPFIHFVEVLHEMTTKGAHGHSAEAEKTEGHKH